MSESNQMTVAQLDSLSGMLGAKPQVAGSHPWKIGQHYVIRTVTMIQTGILKEVHAQELVLGDAVWVADTGRFHDFLKDPKKLNEAEPFTQDVIVGRGSVVDAQIIPKYPAVQK